MMHKIQDGLIHAIQALRHAYERIPPAAARSPFNNKQLSLSPVRTSSERNQTDKIDFGRPPYRRYLVEIGFGKMIIWPKVEPELYPKEGTDHRHLAMLLPLPVPALAIKRR